MPQGDDSGYLERLRAAADGGLIHEDEPGTELPGEVGEASTAVLEIVRLAQEAAAAVEADEYPAYEQAMKRIALKAVEQL